jgi:thiamine-monophosphate kinase
MRRKDYFLLGLGNTCMSNLKELGERGLVRMIRDFLPSGVLVGPGDDAAVIELGDQHLVACTDLITFLRHRPDGMSLRDFGWMSMAVNLSDLASMGASPIGFLSAMAMPDSLQVDELMQIVEGMQECAETYDTPIIGGDTKSGEGLIAGTALGLVPKGEMLTRDGARPGDLVAVTGHLGEAAAGFYSIQKGLHIEEAERTLFHPRPRLREGRDLASCGAVSACMDISDGLSTSVAQISEASGVGMQILWESLPEGPHVQELYAAGVSKEMLLLNFGGEYELLFTIREEDLGKVHVLDVDFAIIGRVVGGHENVLIRDSSMFSLGDLGYEHFRR